VMCGKTGSPNLVGKAKGKKGETLFKKGEKGENTITETGGPKTPAGEGIARTPNKYSRVPYDRAVGPW